MDKLFLLFFLLLFTLIILDKGNSHRTRNGHVRGIIGAILDYNSRIGKEQGVAMKIALEDFNEYSNQTFTLIIRDSKSEHLQAALAARHLIRIQKVEAIIGTSSWEDTSIVAEIGTQTQTPILSLADATPNWATVKWPFLVGASTSQLNQMKAIAGIIQSWEWHQVTVLYEDTEYLATGALPHLSSALKEVGAEIGELVPVPPLDCSSLSKELKRLKEGQCRVFIVHMSFQLTLGLFESAKQMEMMGKDYVWITTDYFSNLLHTLNASTISSMQGLVAVKSYFPEHSSGLQDFNLRFKKRFSLEYPEEVNHEPGIFAVQAYDAAIVLAKAMKTSTKRGHSLMEKLELTDIHGLSGKAKFKHRKLEPATAFQIINVIGKSYIELGFWSTEFGFSKTLEEGAATRSLSMKALGLVFWPGGPWGTPKGWTVSGSSKPLRIGVPTGSLFPRYVNVEQNPEGPNNLSFSGFAIDLFKATVENLPFYLPYEFLSFDGTYDALVEQIHLKNFDAVVGDVAIVSKRLRHAEFTHPYTESGLVMIVPVQAKNHNKAWLFMKPFTTEMWVLIAVINLYNGFVVWLIERNHRPDLNGSRLNQTGSLIFLSFTTLFSQQVDRLHSNLSRMTVVVWLLVALVITQIYTANLASLLTVERLEPTVADVQALINGNAVVGNSKGSFVASYLVDVLHFRRENIRNFTSTDEFVEAFRRREVAAVFIEISLAKLFLAKYCNGFTIAGPTYKVGGFGFAFPRRSLLLPSVTEALLQVAENGKLRELEDNMLAQEKCQDMKPEDESQSLSPSSFWVLFILSGTTSSLALIAYMLACSCCPFNNHQLDSIRRLMIAVIKYWQRQRRFSLRVTDAPALPHHNPPNSTDAQIQV